MPRLLLALLGGFRAELGSGVALALPTRKTKALLAYLASPPGRAHPRDKLASLLWGGAQMSRARSGLRQALFALRRALAATEPPGLRLVADSVALDPAAVEVDVVAFEAAATAATPAALEQAVALYQGDALEGFSLAEPSFEEWLLAERERLRELAVETMARLLAHQRSTGAIPAAIDTALKLLAVDPLQEPVHRTLMRLYADAGRRGTALRQYQVCTGILRRELGTTPEGATRRLYQEILQQRSPAPAGLGGPQALPRPDARWGVDEHLVRDTPLVGRRPELARLRLLVDETSAGNGRLAAVVGEAGIGKSRLVAEVLALAAERGGRVLVGRAFESEQILAFGPWVAALRAGRVSDDAALADHLGAAWRVELARLLPELGDPATPPGSEPADYRRLFEAVAEVLASLATRQALVVVLEDLHWADEMSIGLLGFLGRRLRGSPVLVVATAREEDLADAPILRRTLEDLTREGRLARLRLGPLSRAETVALVRAIGGPGGRAPALARLAEHVWAVSEGHPFVAVEALRELHEGAEPRPLEGRRLPERVREMILRRLERLAEPARQLVAVAAVIGREFDFALAHRAGGLAEEVAAECLEELVRRGILHGVGERFDFTHHRIAETVYGSLLEPRRKTLHRRVGETLESLHATDLEPHVLALGLHYQAGQVWDRAAAYLRRAGAAATARSANREAVACLEQALAALERLPDDRERHEQAIDLRFELRNALFPLGEHQRALDHLRSAEALAGRLGDARRHGWALTYLSNSFWRMADQPRALEAGQRALALATHLGETRLEALTNFRLGQAYEALGDYRRAAAVLRRSVTALHGALGRERFGLAGLPSVFARAFLAAVEAEQGAFAEALAIGEDALRIAEAAQQPFSIAIADFAIGLTAIRRGELSRAVAVLEHGRRICQTVDVPTVAVKIDVALGQGYAQMGRAAEAEPLLAGAVEAAARIFRTVHAFAIVALGEAHLVSGQLDAAARVVSRGLELARAGGERGNEAQALRLLGEIAAAEDLGGHGGAAAARPARAMDHLVRALGLAQELGMRPLAAHCHLGLGRLQQRTGARGGGADHLGEAIALYREMAMTSWLRRAERSA